MPSTIAITNHIDPHEKKTFLQQQNGRKYTHKNEKLNITKRQKKNAPQNLPQICSRERQGQPPGSLAEKLEEMRKNWKEFLPFLHFFLKNIWNP